ncbi:hypothetical protein P3342_002885 [Pyrenophora teres f. teres]|uniref:Uncharacterized protein n=1 Tax=Pyrenophora teres f. teres (strain 0-1) TaxID=861557 RepID=E3RWD9_PYRTT|nr:hypothetical protein PTT_13588 [Pyrenophora teres f. teres 0-1]KAK1915079.1 hypothetical protein P3342_002885 [Pyrenophora teres f. teres]
MRLIIASTAMFALGLALEPRQPQATAPTGLGVSACCQAPAPGPPDAPANWCENLYQGHMFCCEEYIQGQPCRAGFGNLDRVALFRGTELSSSGGARCAGGQPHQQGISACVMRQ